MLDPKEIYIREHERLIALAEDDGMEWTDAYEATADAAYDAMTDVFANAVDMQRERSKEL